MSATPADPPPALGLRRLIAPIEQFFRVEAAGGVVLLGCALLALAWANSPWAGSYHALWHFPIALRLGQLAFERDLHFFINDGVMVIFFFVVGLEIRRELNGGELSDARRAALPVVAAIGGMIAPALIYWGMNPTGPGSRGWGVPTATDIAFAVGVLALLGRRVPPALRVLLLSLSIIDDIGAILVIACFYSSGIAWAGLAIAVAGVLAIVVLQRLGVRRTFVYVVPALVIWVGLLHSGIHPTIGGVIVGLLTPVTPRLGRETISPLARLEGLLHPWVAYAIMPLFALANAGVGLSAVDLSEPGATAIALGVVVGLAAGKPLGIVSISLLAVRFGICALPSGVGKKAMLVLGTVAGIGFTMSLFVAQLAFADPAHLSVAKLAVLVGSAVSGAVGLGLGWVLLDRPEQRRSP